MNQPPVKKRLLIKQLRSRMDEVAEHRASRWLEELDRSTQRSAKRRLIDRIEEVSEELATKWLNELDARLGWIKYREEHDGFCYGIGFGECEDCAPAGDNEVCPNYEHCKDEYVCEWPGTRR